MMPPMTKLSFENQIRKLIENNGESRYKIAIATEIDHATFSRFMNGKGGLSIQNLNALADYLDWTILAKAKSPRRRKAGK